MRRVALLVAISACGRIAFDEVTGGGDPLADDDLDGVVNVDDLCAGDDRVDTNGNQVPDACDPCVRATPPLACELHGVPENGYPNWEERVYVVGINAIRAAHVAYRNRYMVFSDSTGSQVFANNPAPKPPMFYLKRLGEGARLHAVNRAGCHPGPASTSVLCDNTPSSTWVAPYQAYAAAFSRHLAPFSLDLPWYRAGAAACGFANADLTYSQCDLDSNGQRIILFFDAPRMQGIGYGSVAGDVASYWTMLVDSNPPPFAFPIASGSHFYYQGALWFGVNVEMSAAPSAVELFLDGERLAMPLDLGTPTRGFHILGQPTSTGCRSYHFILTETDGTVWRYPARGELRTRGEGGCVEVYAP